MKTGTTCLIPFYNEEQRLIDTLNVITQINNIDQIICINDGSSDNSVSLLKKFYPNIKLVNFKNNKGKTEAIRSGLKLVKTKYAFLLDADLKNLSESEIEKALNHISNNADIGMMILQRINEPILVRLFRFDIILSGQRILKTKILNEILKKDIAHYDLEVAINEYFKINKLKTTSFPISAINTGRAFKWGPKRSFLTNVHMIKRFMVYPGLISIFKQMLNFARD